MKLLSGRERDCEEKKQAEICPTLEGKSQAFQSWVAGIYCGTRMASFAARCKSFLRGAADG